MYQSHASYSSVGLGSDATDQIVGLVRALGPESGLYGAKITGGGSGGTVCVLGADTPAAAASLETVIEAYRSLSGHSPHVFAGSSTGAVAFGHRTIGSIQPVAGAPAAGKRKARDEFE